MPTYTTILSHINPVEFWDKNYSQQAQFNSRHINDYKLPDTLLPWQERAGFRQVWQTNDSIRLQVRTDAGPVTWRLYNCDNVQVDTDAFVQVLQNFDNPAEYIYQSDIDLSVYTEGTYYLQLEVGSPVNLFLISDYFELSEICDNSLLLNYRNSSFKDDVLFETGFAPVIRIKGHLQYKEPGSKDVVYEDQVLNETVIESKAFDLWDLFLSDELGIPDYMVRKLNGILGCDTLIIDNRYYARSEGSRLEAIAIEYYPLRGWRIELREQLNRRAKYYSSSGSTNLGLSVLLNTDSKGFIDGESGGSVFQIEDIQ